MDVSGLTTVFNCCIAGGLAVPVLDLLLSGFSNVLNIDLDFDGDTTFDGPVPVTLSMLAFSAVVFGAVGRCALGKTTPLPALLIAAAFAVLGGYLLGRFVIRPLRRSRAYALGINAFEGREGIMKLEARSDFTGTVTVLSAIGSKVTYDARPIPPHDKISIGTKVRIVQVDSGKRLCLVEPLEDTGAVPESLPNI